MQFGKLHHLCIQKEKMSKHRLNIQTISVYISTSLVLVLFGTMCLLFTAAQSLSDHIRGNLTIAAVIRTDATEPEILTLQKQIEKKNYTALTRYISKEEILEAQKKELGTDPEEFLGYNPYEASIELSVEPQYANNDSLAKIEKELLDNRLVSEVVYHKELVDIINSNIQRISAVLLVFLLFLTLISWSLISNMVRLSIYSKRFLLHTMKLVGATWGFIRRPFLIHNLYIGLASGIMANMVLGGALYMIMRHEPGITTILTMEKVIMTGVAVVAFGIGITLLCAYSSVNRFLRMKGNDLYFI